MQPFLHDKLFEPNQSISIGFNFIGEMPLIVVDNIFKNFSNIRDIILNTPVGNWKYDINGFNYKDYYDCQIIYPLKQYSLFNISEKIIKKALNLNTTLLEKNAIKVNWFKQINQKRSNFAFPHDDQTLDTKMFTCLIYLNNKNESLGGTAFFKNKVTNNIDGAKDDNFFDLYPETVENGYDYWSPEKYWEIIAFAEMIPNRLIIFPSNYYHAAYHPENGFYDDPRLTLVYWMKQT
jgi:hypothetical protein